MKGLYNMGMYESWSFRNLNLTKEQYRYLLPAVNRSRLVCRVMDDFSEEYYYFGNDEDSEDILRRLGGLKW